MSKALVKLSLGGIDKCKDDIIEVEYYKDCNALSCYLTPRFIYKCNGKKLYVRMSNGVLVGYCGYRAIDISSFLEENNE